MDTCSILTGQGFDLSFLGSFSMAWLGLVILAFIIIFARKWIGEEAGYSFSTFFAGLFAGVVYVLVVTLTCSYKIALVAGLIGLAFGGFGLGYFFGQEG